MPHSQAKPGGNANMATTSLLATAVNIFAAPNEAFPVIRERPRPMFPLALIILGFVLLTVTYVNLVDLPWYLESQMRASPAVETMSDAEIAEAADAAARSPGFIATIGAVSTSIFVTILYVVFALYLWAASSIGKHGIRFVQAFALVCWCALPGLLGFVAGIVNLLTNDPTFMPQHLINPLSFSSILGIEPVPGSGGQQILLGLDLTAVWAAVLMVLGYKAWSGKSLVVAATIVLAPYALLIALGLGFSN
jgi:hypothetical protein